MSEERFRRLRELFEDFCECPAGDRRQGLLELERSDPSLADSLQLMLRALEDDALERKILEAFHVDPGAAAGVGAVPERIASYRILRELGRGGVGLVYLGEQESPRRQVAVKVLQSAHPSAQERLRFEREAEVLGRLNHPCIAQIHEAGVAVVGEGRRPFLAMEFVDGVDVLRHARDHGLGLEERVRLFEAICSAVEAAHEQGIVHRDLKPANVLVRADGVPKVVDFGIARGFDSESSNPTITQVGQVVGTIAYLGPEILNGTETDVETRGDVYSLGVMLYELISGRPPRDLVGLGLMDAIRRVCEEPARPLLDGEEGVDEDLRAIVSTAMDSDPRRRYRTAGALRRDLQRYLEHRPIEARPPTRWVVLRKYARRHRGLFWGLGLAATFLVLGIMGVVWFAVQAGREASANEALAAEEKRQRAAAVAAEEATSAANRQLGTTNEELRRAMAALEIENQTVRSMHEFILGKVFLASDPWERPEVDMTLGKSLEWGAMSVDSHPFASVEAEARVRLLLARGFVGIGLPAASIEQLRAIEELPWARAIPVDVEVARLQVLGRAQLTREELATQRELLRLMQESAIHRPVDLLSVELRVALLELQLGQHDLARERYGRIAPTAAPLAEQSEPDRVLLLGLAEMEMALENLERADSLWARLVARDRERAHPMSLAGSLLGWAHVQRRRSRPVEALASIDEAIQLYETWLPAGHPHHFRPLFERACVLLDLRRYGPAEDQYRACLEYCREPMTPNVEARVYKMLGVVCAKVERLDEAAEHYRRALEILEQGDPRFLNGDLSTALGSLEVRRRHPERAIPYYEQALERYRRVMGETHPKTFQALQNLGRAWSLQGRFDRAAEPLERALEFSSLGPVPRAVGSLNLAQAYRGAGREEEGHALLEQAFLLFQEHTPPGHDARVQCGLDRASSLSERGRIEQAIELLRIELEGCPSGPAWSRARAAFQASIQELRARAERESD